MYEKRNFPDPFIYALQRKKITPQLGKFYSPVKEQIFHREAAFKTQKTLRKKSEKIVFSLHISGEFRTFVES